MNKHYFWIILSFFIISIFLVSCTPKIVDGLAKVEPQLSNQIDAHCKDVGLDKNLELCITNLAKERQDASFCTNLLEGEAENRCLSAINNSQ